MKKSWYVFVQLRTRGGFFIKRFGAAGISAFAHASPPRFLSSTLHKLLESLGEPVVYFDAYRVCLLVMAAAEAVGAALEIRVFGMKEKVVRRYYIAELVVAKPPDEKVTVAYNLDKRPVRLGAGVCCYLASRAAVCQLGEKLARHKRDVYAAK